MSRQQDAATKGGTGAMAGGDVAYMNASLGAPDPAKMAAMNYRPGQAPQGKFGGGGMLGSANSANYSNIRPGARSMVFDQSFGGQGQGGISNNAGGKIQAANDYMNRNRGFAPTGGADLMSGVAVGRGPAMNPVMAARQSGMMGSNGQPDPRGLPVPPGYGRR